MDRLLRRLLVLGTVFVLAAAGCASDDGTDGAAEPKDGPTITVGSFNFPESVLLAEIYTQTMEHNGYPVERKLDLGAREVIFPSLESGDIDFLPEYVGSALSVGFEVKDVYTDSDEGHAELTQRFAGIDVTVLAYAPAQDRNAFVVTKAYADEHDLQDVSDLAAVGTFTFGGPPECEERDTCLVGLRDTYGLSGARFESIQEGGARVAALTAGDIDVALLFSTDPVIVANDWVSLNDDKGIIPVENIVPVLSDEVADAYGTELTDLLDSVSEVLTTEVLLSLNQKVQLDGEDADDVAGEWLAAEGFVS